MQQIVESHYPAIKQDLLKAAMDVFFDLREVPGLKKKPSTSELLDWIKLLIADDLPADALGADNIRTVLPRMHGALLKNEQDIHLFERIIFLHKQQNKR